MESVPLEMDDIFADHEDDDNFPARLPDLPEELEPLNTSLDNVTPSQDTENADVLARLKDLSKGAARKTVRRPIPKLDSARLTGDRGIPILPQVFKDVTFKGKGHEAEDLKLMMGKLEHWAHRLFPKMPFDEVLERIEKLGGKKEVQTCVKKMRLDMPLWDSDFVSRGEEEPDDTNTALPDLPQSPMEVDQDVEEQFDEMMRIDHEEETNNDSQVVRSSQVTPQAPRQATLATTPSATPRLLGSPLNTGGPVPDNVLTPEQLERMERNKRLAQEKRNARLNRTTESATPTSKQKTPVKARSSNNGDDTAGSSDTTFNKPTIDSHSPNSQEGVSSPNLQENISPDKDPKHTGSRSPTSSPSDDIAGKERKITGEQTDAEPTANDQMEVTLESYTEKVCSQTEWHGDKELTGIVEDQNMALTKSQTEQMAENKNSGMITDQNQLTSEFDRKDELSITRDDAKEGLEQSKICEESKKNLDTEDMSEDQQTADEILNELTSEFDRKDELSTTRDDAKEGLEQSKICEESKKNLDTEDMSEDQQTADEILNELTSEFDGKDELSTTRDDAKEGLEQSKICEESEKSLDTEDMSEDQQTADEILNELTSEFDRKDELSTTRDDAKEGLEQSKICEESEKNSDAEQMADNC